MTAWIIDYVNWKDPLDVFTKPRGYIYRDGELVLESLDITPGMRPLEWDDSDTLDIRYWDVLPGSGDYRERGRSWTIEACLLGEFLHDMTPAGLALRLKGLPGLTMARLILETVRDSVFLAAAPKDVPAWR